MRHESPCLRLALALVVLALSACGKSASPAQFDADSLRGRLVITGSSTVAPLAARVTVTRY